MSTTCSATRQERISASTRYASRLILKCWLAIQEWRERRRLCAALSGLSDRELNDIGTTRGEIDYVASNRDIDPRGTRSAEWVRSLPTVDGQLRHLWTEFR